MATLTVSKEEEKRLKGMGFLSNKGTDNFSARVITVNGKVTAAQQRCLAEAAEKFGNGILTFTTRQTVEVQGIEYYKGKPIFYSLGNFVFGSSIPKTMLVQAAFTGDSLSLQLIPGTSSGGYTRMLTDAESKTQFYQYLDGISFGVSVGEDGIVSPQP